MLHYNGNYVRKQAETKLGGGGGGGLRLMGERYVVLYPKYNRGGLIVPKITEECTYGKFFSSVIYNQ